MKENVRACERVRDAYRLVHPTHCSRSCSPFFSGTWVCVCVRSKMIGDHKAFVRTIMKAGNRKDYAATDLSEILPEEIIDDVKEAAEISMGTEVRFSVKKVLL